VEAEKEKTNNSKLGKIKGCLKRTAHITGKSRGGRSPHGFFLKKKLRLLVEASSLINLS
jgi:hypothetical protein